jgi:SAM-dependent methyltransferase
MLKLAEHRRVGIEDKLTFSHSNIQDLNLNNKFDIVVSLFHVMSYQNSNKELIKAFEVAKNHLKDDGIFIFDFWYGPAVLTDPPVTRVKKLENKNIKVTRIAESVMHSKTNITDVNFKVFIEDKNKKEIIEKNETHNMRYFFDTELEIISEQTGFKILNKHEWMTTHNPNFNSWNVVWTLKK